MKWVRAKDGVIAGVCKGMANALDLEVGWVRLAWIVTLLFAGIGLLPYILIWICIPREDQIQNALKPKFLGVCLRVSERMEIEVGIVRLICLFLFLSSMGATLIGYIILYFILEKKPDTPIA